MRRFYNPNQVNSLSLLVILGIAALVGGSGLLLYKNAQIGVTPAEIYAAENGYDLAYKAATLYVKTCNAGAIPASCHATVSIISTDLANADAAYMVIMGYETNPPSGAAATFTAAVAILEAAIPQV